jgi:hypothetical protein
MRKNDFEQFVALLAAEAEIRNAKPLSEGALLLWWQRMQRFELDQVLRAFDRHSQDAERGRFMPQPADLIRFLEGSATDKAMLAWGKAIDAASRVGAYSDVVFDDAAIHAAIEDMGGWPKFCRGDVKDLSYLQHRFTQSYTAYSNRGEFEYPARLVGDRSADDVYAKRGLPPPKPAVIGDVERARAVARIGRRGGKTPIAFAGIVDALERRDATALLPNAGERA